MNIRDADKITIDTHTERSRAQFRHLTTTQVTALRNTAMCSRPTQ